MKTQHTDTQLKQALAKMLQKKLSTLESSFEDKPTIWSLHWDWPHTAEEVFDTELLHLCWLLEKQLGDDYYSYFQHLESWSRLGRQPKDNNERLWWCIHATWQQRVVALAKVKGKE